MVPYRSHIPPIGHRQAPKADLRREIPPWRALTWAYADECVGIATNVPDSHHLYVSNGLAQTVYAERQSRGAINGALDAHEDAFAIDGFVYEACGRDPAPYSRIRAAAEKRLILPATLDVPPLRCIARRNDRGRPELVYPVRGRHEPILCLVTYDGYDVDEADRMRRDHAMLYDLFLNVMDCLQDLALQKWRIQPLDRASLAAIEVADRVLRAGLENSA